MFVSAKNAFRSTKNKVDGLHRVLSADSDLPFVQYRGRKMTVHI